MGLCVIQTGDGHVVLDPDGVTRAGPFATNDEAWRALDRLVGEPISPAEKRTDWMVARYLNEGA